MFTSIKPRFITFEGIDGCGKSTQAELLNDYLLHNNIQSTIVREPGGTSISEKVRDILLSKINTSMSSRTEALLMTASRAQLTKEIIIPQRKTGSWIVSDRYSDSTLAYQVYGKGVNKNFVDSVHKHILGNTKPDLTFILKAKISKAMQRLNKRKRKNRYDKFSKNFYNKVQKAFIKIAKQNKKRYLVGDNSFDTPETEKIIFNKFISLLKN